MLCAKKAINCTSNEQTYYSFRMKNLRSLFLLGLLLLVVPFTMVAQKVQPHEMRVMSFNIRNGEANDGVNGWKYRIPAVRALIADQDPDVFGVQEAFRYQLKDILRKNKIYKQVGVGREDGKKKDEHMSIFYKKDKYKLLSWGTFWLSETPNVPSTGWDGACRRTATWAVLRERQTGRTFFMVNTHLDHVGKEARKQGLALIVRKIEQMNQAHYPMVLTGDFNVTLEDDCLHSLDGKMLSARDMATVSDSTGSYNEWGHVSPERPIDYIYYKGMKGCKSFRVVRKMYDNRKFASDHFPVICTLLYD